MQVSTATSQTTLQTATYVRMAAFALRNGCGQTGYRFLCKALAAANREKSHLKPDIFSVMNGLRAMGHKLP